MSFRIFVPRDTSAIACGADAVAEKIQSEAEDRGVDVTVVRNGSRGLCWLEPLVEVDMGEDRYGFGPIEVGEVASLFECGFAQNSPHPKALAQTPAAPLLFAQWHR